MLCAPRTANVFITFLFLPLSAIILPLAVRLPAALTWSSGMMRDARAAGAARRMISVAAAGVRLLRTRQMAWILVVVRVLRKAAARVGSTGGHHGHGPKTGDPDADVRLVRDRVAQVPPRGADTGLHQSPAEARVREVRRREFGTAGDDERRRRIEAVGELPAVAGPVKVPVERAGQGVSGHGSALSEHRPAGQRHAGGEGPARAEAH